MQKKIILGFSLTFLYASMFLSAFHIEPVRAIGTITIKADGSIDPPTAPISTNDGITYTLTGDVTTDGDGIVVERGNIVVDGSGFAVHGSGSGTGYGIFVIGLPYVTIQNIQVEGFYYGIWLSTCSNCLINENNITNNGGYGVGLYWPAAISVSGNNITNNVDGIWFGRGMYVSISRNTITKNSGDGIRLWSSSGNSISGNTVTDNTGSGIAFGTSTINSISQNALANNVQHGVYLDSSPSNEFVHNNFINNGAVYSKDSSDVWDAGYPSGGNYWSDYVNADENNGPYQNLSGNDGIWDHAYVVDKYNIDRYPFTELWGESTYDVTVKAQCNFEDVDVNVNVDIDGSAGYTTPQILTDLRGTHTFTVPETDANGHLFKQWNTGQTTTTITTSINGTLTAIYDVMLNLAITATSGGTTRPAPGIQTYWSGAVIIVAAAPNIDRKLDHWELDNLNVGLTNPYSVFLNSSHTLNAVFGMLGDCNSDGAVEILDLAIVGVAFGSYPGHPRWIAAADECRDNIVDIFDLVVVALHFGAH